MKEVIALRKQLVDLAKRIDALESGIKKLTMVVWRVQRFAFYAHQVNTTNPTAFTATASTGVLDKTGASVGLRGVKLNTIPPRTVDQLYEQIPVDEVNL